MQEARYLFFSGVRRLIFFTLLPVLVFMSSVSSYPPRDKSYVKHDVNGLSYLIPFKLMLLAFYTVCNDLHKHGNVFNVGDGSVIIFQFYFFTTNKWTPNCTNGF